ncbi:MAG: ATP-binding cassette domain-containing protein [Planctomycetes bacterium]|nr:ATP-binding cassette domain-containing protein [Planctomycetota bacterium]
MTTILAVDIRSVKLEDREVLCGINLSFSGGQLVGIVGPNGGGKTTLLHCLAGLTSFSGIATLDGKPLRYQRRRIALLQQNPELGLHVPLTALEVVLLGSLCRGRWIRRPGRGERRRALAILEQLGIGGLASHAFSSLSGGEQAMTLLGRCLLSGADVYLLDEPYSHVDARGERAMHRVLGDLVEAGKLVIVVDHHLQHLSAEGYGRILLIRNWLVADGPPQKVLRPDVLESAYGNELRTMALGARR